MHIERHLLGLQCCEWRCLSRRAFWSLPPPLVLDYLRENWNPRTALKVTEKYLLKVNKISDKKDIGFFSTKYWLSYYIFTFYLSNVTHFYIIRLILHFSDVSYSGSRRSLAWLSTTSFSFRIICTILSLLSSLFVVFASSGYSTLLLLFLAVAVESLGPAPISSDDECIYLCCCFLSRDGMFWYQSWWWQQEM